MTASSDLAVSRIASQQIPAVCSLDRRRGMAQDNVSTEQILGFVPSRCRAAARFPFSLAFSFRTWLCAFPGASVRSCMNLSGMVRICTKLQRYICETESVF
jgi:hypothetical protein